MRLENKTALITGAASGIGAACATMFQAEGARVACVDRNESALADVAGVSAMTAVLDVTDNAAVESLVEQVDAQLGGIDILINCAGITGRHVDPGLDWVQAWQQIMDVNVKGTLLASAHVMAVQRRIGRGGAIVNLSSIYGQVARPPFLTGPPDGYTHSKGAVLQMTRDMAVSGAPDKIRVNALCPGFIRTPLTQGLRENNEMASALTNIHPLGRFGESDEVAHCALFLASDEASFVTGASLAVDGGYLAI
jgi:NAD(P)-dependent dehydrogenase (short-subunit alcohol dehydrogenase family)